MFRKYIPPKFQDTIQNTLCQSLSIRMLTFLNSRQPARGRFFHSFYQGDVWGSHLGNFQESCCKLKSRGFWHYRSLFRLTIIWYTVFTEIIFKAVFSILWPVQRLPTDQQTCPFLPGLNGALNFPCSLAVRHNWVLVHRIWSEGLYSSSRAGTSRALTHGPPCSFPSQLDANQHIHLGRYAETGGEEKPPP